MGEHIIGKDDNNPIDIDQFEKITELIENIEKTRQEPTIKQIEAADKDNERQYQFALKKLESDNRKWAKSFWAGAIASGILGACGLVFLFQGKYDIGIGLLTTTFAGVFGYIAGAGSCNKND